MPSSAPRETARIYQFPVRPRARAAGRPGGGQRTGLEAMATTRVVDDGAWYHEAAVEEARTLKR